MFNKQKLVDEITHQTRNGRQDLYLKVEDLKHLGLTGLENETAERIYISEKEVNKLLADYDRHHFRDSLKVDVPRTTHLTGIDKTDYHFKSVDREI